MNCTRAPSGRSEGEGRGCEFTVSLPLSERPVVKPSVAVLPTAPQRLKIVVIEDNADAREAIAEFLALLGHDVSTAADGANGLQLLSTVRPEVAVVDIGLPVVDGYEIARQVRADPVLCEARLIALTGYGQPEDRQRAHESGFDVHLVKPVDLASLVRVMAELRPAEAQSPAPAAQSTSRALLTDN